MPLWIGIDVAKDTLAVHVLPLDQLLSFPNTAQGHQRLCDHLAGQSVGNALLEATGGYERAVMTALATAGDPGDPDQSAPGTRFRHGLGHNRQDRSAGCGLAGAHGSTGASARAGSRSLA
ncbi:hypothetical protein [Xanthomonas translucens]|uniref:hypothetical protein n=1 Tax=Xanthomonas campestris pv. translucens TaxID=343 RepID=UPI001F51420D|nr:hypothetical protein [Xanthomonas translucens]